MAIFRTAVELKEEKLNFPLAGAEEPCGTVCSGARLGRSPQLNAVQFWPGYRQAELSVSSSRGSPPTPRAWSHAEVLGTQCF